MNRQNFLNALELQQQTTLDQNVKAQRLIKYQTLILDSDDALTDGGNLAQVQLAHQAAFIDALDKTRTLETVNLYRGTDDLAAQLVSLLKKRMHAPVIHQANEGNEEFRPAALCRDYRKKRIAIAETPLPKSTREFPREEYPLGAAAGVPGRMARFWPDTGRPPRVV